MLNGALVRCSGENEQEEEPGQINPMGASARHATGTGTQSRSDTDTVDSSGDIADNRLARINEETLVGPLDTVDDNATGNSAASSQQEDPPESQERPIAVREQRHQLVRSTSADSPQQDVIHRTTWPRNTEGTYLPTRVTTR